MACPPTSRSPRRAIPRLAPRAARSAAAVTLRATRLGSAPTSGNLACSSIAGRRASGFLQVSLSKVSRHSHRSVCPATRAETPPITLTTDQDLSALAAIRSTERGVMQVGLMRVRRGSPHLTSRCDGAHYGYFAAPPVRRYAASLAGSAAICGRRTIRRQQKRNFCASEFGTSELWRAVR